MEKEFFLSIGNWFKLCINTEVIFASEKYTLAALRKIPWIPITY